MSGILPLYESKAIDMAWLDLDFTESGLGEDTFLEVAQTSDMVTVTRGADGKVAPSKMASADGGTLTLTLKQTAPINKALAKIASDQMKTGAPLKVGNFIVNDRQADSASFVALDCFLTRRSDHSFGNSMGDQVWVWEVGSFLPTDDIDTLTATLTVSI